MRLEFAPLAAIFSMIASTIAPAFAQPIQTESRTLHFVNVDSQRSYQEMLTVLRQVAGAMPQPPSDDALHAVTVTGSGDQLAAANWIVTELDGAKTEVPQLGTRSAPQHREFTGTRGMVVNIVYLDPAATQLDMQEIITTLRLVADVNHIFNYSARKAIVYQASPDRALLAQWLISTLEKPATASTKDASAATDEYALSGAPDDITRVFHWDSAVTPAEVQQLVRKIRTEEGIIKIFTYARTRAFAVRGTAAQLAVVSGLVVVPPPSR